ncbi:F-box/kelch-repeat protein At3g23880-like [Vicia villosa]|uniref:F-box/kelch-repeat protein At3g23880-like n=1 Tax=Vicia villosa TaxID=3911 RepID=UPI00273C0733|nr:F-box/kelch-repeat protein At3g23880-like [Vicia villosa]
MNAHSPQHSNQTPMSNVLLPDELIVEILSLLPVKFLIEFKSICKSWKTLISEPTFIKLHLQQSSKTPHITLTSSIDCSIRPLPVHRLLDTTTTTSITLPDHNHFQLNHILDRGDLNVVGSSNGLLCLLGNFYSYNYEHYYEQIFLYLWNPATAELSNRKVFLNKVEHLPYYERFGLTLFRSWNFAFGYDNSTDTYKIVALNLTSNKVKVWNFGRLNYFWGDHDDDDDYGKGWRSIQSFSLIPLDNTDWYEGISNSVHVSGTLNWLAIRDDSPQSDRRCN